MSEVAIPEDLWDAAGEGVIAAWLFRDGEVVTQGAVLAEIMYEKSAMELIAPAAGRLTILVPAEAPVSKGQVIARIAVEPES
jgi:pyruvate/2-oxoglutarate dehydrogenase complex dihydrolipoamide acyltransferase (E2) component